MTQTTWTVPSTSSTSTPTTPVPTCAELAGWAQLAGVSPTCAACVPLSPDVVAPLVWEPCGDGTPGCQELLVDWMNDGEHPFFINFAGVATPDGPLLVVTRRLEGGEVSGWAEAVAEMVLSRSDGSPLGAMRGVVLPLSRGCSPAKPAFGASRLIASLGSGHLDEEYQIDVSLATGAVSVFNTLSPETLHGNWTEARSAGPLFAAVGLSPAREILTVPYDGSDPTLVAKFSLEHQWQPSEPMTVGAEVIFWAFDGPNGGEQYGQAFIYHSETGTIESYLDRPGWDVLPMRTDGTTLVWLQASPPYYAPDGFAHDGEPPDALELWSSPYSPSPSGLAPEKIADLHTALWNDDYFLESGLVVLRSSMQQPQSPDYAWSRVIALRLADKVYWTLDAPAGDWLGDPMYAAPNEVAMPLQPAQDQTRTYTVRRQELSALGPPVPLAGMLGVP